MPDAEEIGQLDNEIQISLFHAVFICHITDNLFPLRRHLPCIDAQRDAVLFPHPDDAGLSVPPFFFLFLFVISVKQVCYAFWTQKSTKLFV